MPSRRRVGAHIRGNSIVGNKQRLNEKAIKVLAAIKFHPSSITREEIMLNSNLEAEDVERQVRLLLNYGLINNHSRFPPFPREGWRVFTSPEKHTEIVKILKDHGYEDEATRETREGLGGYFPTGLELEGTGRQPNRGRDYPPIVPINEQLEYKSETLSVMRKFRDEKKPFRPKQYSDEAKESKLKKFKWLSEELSRIYEIPAPEVEIGIMDEETWKTPSSSGSSYYTNINHKIIMEGRFSVITFLHEYGHARGFDETDATIWSANLFKRIFPVSYSKLERSAHTLVQPGPRPFEL